MDNNIRDRLQNSAGAITGVGTYYITNKLIKKSARKFFRTLEPKLTPEDNLRFKKNGYQMYNDLFKDKGIELYDIPKEDFDSYTKSRYEQCSSYYDKKIAHTKNPIKRFFLNLKKNTVIDNAKKLDNATKKGENAYFTVLFQKVENSNPLKFKKVSKIVINMDKSAIFLPHELGHAKNHVNNFLNFTMMKFLKNKLIQNKAIFTILGIALLTKPKLKDNENKKPKNPLYPVGLFIKNNCGKLATLITIPTILEETLANFNGQQMSKKYFSKEDLKLLKRSHLNSFGSYLLFGCNVGLAVYLANKAKDKITNLELKN